MSEEAKQWIAFPLVMVACIFIVAGKLLLFHWLTMLVDYITGLII